MPFSTFLGYGTQDVLESQPLTKVLLGQLSLLAPFLDPEWLGTRASHRGPAALGCDVGRKYVLWEASGLQGSLLQQLDAADQHSPAGSQHQSPLSCSARPDCIHTAHNLFNTKLQAHFCPAFPSLCAPHRVPNLWSRSDTHPWSTLMVATVVVMLTRA